MITLHEDDDGVGDQNYHEDHYDDADGSLQEGQLVRLADRWTSSYIHQIILCIIPFIILFYIHQVIH